MQWEVTTLKRLMAWCSVAGTNTECSGVSRSRLRMARNNPWNVRALVVVAGSRLMPGAAHCG